MTDPASPNASVETEFADEPTPGRRPPMRMLWIALGAASALVAVAVVAFVLVASSKSPFEAAIDECDLGGSSYIRIGDEGNTLLVDTEGDESEGARFSDTACVMVSLGVPDSTIARMDSTRALDGVQQDTFDGITAQWSYHPNSGLDVIFTR